VEFHGAGCIMFVKGCNSTAVRVTSVLDSVWSKFNLCNMVIFALTFSLQISVHYVFHCIKRDHMYSTYVVCTELKSAGHKIFLVPTGPPLYEKSRMKLFHHKNQPKRIHYQYLFIAQFIGVMRANVW